MNNNRRNQGDPGFDRPREVDVILGRGQGQNHTGTRMYRYLVKRNQERYCLDRRNKRNIAQSIVEAIRNQGRYFFAKRRDGTWYRLTDQQAIHKTSQALREGQPGRIASLDFLPFYAIHPDHDDDDQRSTFSAIGDEEVDHDLDFLL
jgi:hypothetical protein